MATPAGTSGSESPTSTGLQAPTTGLQQQKKRKHPTDAGIVSASELEKDTLSVEGEGPTGRQGELVTRITDLEEEKRQVEEGTHPEWKQKCDALERVRTRRVFAAEKFKQMQIENIQGLYEYEVLEAECSYKTAMSDLRGKLLDTMEQRVRRLEEDKERVMKQLERISQTRTLRSKASTQKDSIGDGLTAGVTTRSMDDSAYGNVSMFLTDVEIKDDLKRISADLAERAKAYYSAANETLVEVAVEDNCLHYGEHCLLKGESIVFTSMLSGEDFFGRIALIRPTEILVKLTDGTKARIHMAYLRNGRIRMKVDDDFPDGPVQVS